MICVEDLHKSFDGAAVLRGVTLTVATGEILALVGPSGGGKSVFLKHLVGLLQPDRGRVLVDGQDVSRLHGRALQRLRHRFGFLFQGGALFKSMTVFDNVAFPLREKTRLKGPALRRRVLDQLAQVGLSGSEAKFPAQLSGGMMKRAALARALVMAPQIVLFDEPTTGLDPGIARSIRALITALHRQLGFTGIVVSHEVPRIFEVAQRVAVFHHGAVRLTGTPDEVLASDDPAVRALVRETEPQAPLDEDRELNEGPQ